MIPMTSNEFKDNTLKLLITFSDFCEQHSLKYMLDYGTLLGAIRHKGFIPWDDDIDVSMPRKDYEKLYDLLKKQDFSFSENYKLASVRNKYTVQKPYFNIVDVTTITESTIREKKYFYPVWLDIFPYDQVDTESFDEKNIKFFIRLAQYPIFKTQSKIKSFIKLFLKPFMLFNFHIVDKRCQKDNDKGFNTLHNYFTAYGKKEVINQTYFDNYIYKTFEGHKFRVPKNYDKKLQCTYGNDYMKLPPEDKRISHVNVAYRLNNN